MDETWLFAFGIAFLIALILEFIMFATGFPYINYSNFVFRRAVPHTRGTSSFEKNMDAYLKWVECFTNTANDFIKKIQKKEGE